MDILRTQLDFYKKRKAGCIFAAIIAKNPSKYSWKHYIIDKLESDKIDELISDSIADKKISTVSLLFPSVKTISELVILTKILEKTKSITLEQDIICESSRCLGYRVIVGNNLSWVSGFGNFDFLPKTRQSPYTEIVFRVKKRPNYEWYIKPPIEGVVHLADLDMLRVPKRIFKKWWNSSLRNTKKVLGHSPNLHSAAKTTYSIPIEFFTK